MPPFYCKTKGNKTVKQDLPFAIDPGLISFEFKYFATDSNKKDDMKKEISTFLLLAIGLAACMKTPDYGKLSASFVVQTSKDADANFGSYKTYYISDSIALKTSNPLDSIWYDNDSKQLVETVKANMLARGYTLVSKGNRPDLGMGLTAIEDLNIGVIYPGWWWGYWGGCYWGYCGYPPYYPWGGGIVYSIPTGTLVLDMIDLKDATSDGKLSVPWGSVMSGGLGYTNDDIQLGVEAINQAFTQSTYIQAQ